MKLKYMPDALLASLKHDLEELPSRYLESVPWIDGYARQKGLPKLKETEIEISENIRLLDDTGKAVSDSEAATNVYRALKSLTPVQAGEERLWAGLCHTEPFYSYARVKWYRDNMNARRVKRRFFLESRGVGGLSRNAVSRLWWYGYITHDESDDDPYAYTKMLLEYQDTPVGLLERNLGKNSFLVRQTAKYISRQASTWKDRSKAIQQLCRSLNIAGGAIVLDALDAESLHALLDKCNPQPASTS